MKCYNSWIFPRMEHYYSNSRTFPELQHASLTSVSVESENANYWITKRGIFQHFIKFRMTHDSLISLISWKLGFTVTSLCCYTYPNSPKTASKKCKFTIFSRPHIKTFKIPRFCRRLYYHTPSGYIVLTTNWIPLTDPFTIDHSYTTSLITQLCW